MGRLSKPKTNTGARPRPLPSPSSLLKSGGVAVAAAQRERVAFVGQARGKAGGREVVSTRERRHGWLGPGPSLHRPNFRLLGQAKCLLSFHVMVSLHSDSDSVLAIPRSHHTHFDRSRSLAIENHRQQEERTPSSVESVVYEPPQHHTIMVRVWGACYGMPFHESIACDW